MTTETILRCTCGEHLQPQQIHPRVCIWQCSQRHKLYVQVIGYDSVIWRVEGEPVYPYNLEHK